MVENISVMLTIAMVKIFHSFSDVDYSNVENISVMLTIAMLKISQ